MPPAAAMGVGVAASGIGSLFSAKAGAPKNVPTTAPNALFPNLQQDYTRQLGDAGTTGLQGLKQTAQTGNPVDVGDAFSKMLAAQQQTLSQGRAGLREQFGGAGLMGSSAFRDAATNFETQNSKDVMSQFANMLYNSNEQAQGRKLTAQGMLADQFQTAGTAFTPSSTMVSGAPSAVGSGLSSMGNMLTLFGLMKQK